MNEVILTQDLVFVDQKEAYTDSLIVAKVFGKRHDNVLKDIKGIIKENPEILGLLKFEESSYLNSQNKEQPKYNLSKDALMLLVMGYSTQKAMKIKIAYINEFNRMQRYIQLKEKREEIEERERISAENGSDSGRDLQRRQVEKKANRKALSEVDKELAAFEIFELTPPKTIIH